MLAQPQSLSGELTRDSSHSVRQPLLVLGVCASISAYKAALVVRHAQRCGLQVQVVPTADSLRFVGEATWQALTVRSSPSSVWDEVACGSHVQLAAQADVVAVAPCTADRLAVMAHGLADDLLGCVLLATAAPVLAFPAMHTQMWTHPATAANVELLRQRGVTVVDPDAGALTSGDSGVGRLPEPETIVARIMQAIEAQSLLQASPHKPAGPASGSLTGRKVLISAGGTREPFDAVRYLGNHSSGRQGYALAQAAVARGASVQLVSANVSLGDPQAVVVTSVSTARQMHQVMLRKAADADIVIMAAAVADWRPAHPIHHKHRKEDLPAGAGGNDGAQPRQMSMQLVENPDVLADLCSQRARLGQAGQQKIVGFAAETLDESAPPTKQGFDEQGADQRAWAKLHRKGADLLVVNPVGSEQRLGTGFGTSDNQATLFSSDGQRVQLPVMSKLALAHRIFDHLQQMQ